MIVCESLRSEAASLLSRSKQDATDVTTTDYERFADLTFDGFRELATADGLSRYQRIGFPDAYRDGYEAAIYRDVLGKLSNLHRRGKTVFDIGCGCSDLPFLL